MMRLLDEPMEPYLVKNTIGYRDLTVDLNPNCEKGMALIYQFTTGDEEQSKLRIVPDGCLDMMFRCDPDDVEATIRGYHGKVYDMQLKPHTTYFGVKPYSGFLGLKNIDAKLADIIEKCIPLNEIIDSDEITKQIIEAETLEERADIFVDFWQKNYVDDTYESSLSGYISLKTCLCAGNLKIAALSHDTGYSERYCQKVFSSDYGISIKEYAKMLRFQRAVQLMTGIEGELNDSEIAYGSGYYDEAHMIKDFKNISGMTPKVFYKDMKS
jgi:AraC-like DNA-binding protein